MNDRSLSWLPRDPEPEVPAEQLTGGDELVAPDASGWAETDVLLLAPEPAAARIARDWVAAALAVWPEASVERARLIISELVTNAVLHARTSIVLRLHRLGSRVRVDVGDGEPGGPLPKRFAGDSPTGRGIRLVDALAEDWGVSRYADGKVVWFVIGSGAVPIATTRGTSGPVTGAGAVVEVPGDTGGGGEDVGRRPRWPEMEDVAAGWGATAAGAACVPSTGLPEAIPVQILQLPIAIYLEAEQQNDAVARELALIVHSPDGLPGIDVPKRLVELANAVGAVFGAASNESRLQVERALREGREIVDLRFDVSSDAWPALLQLSAQLDEIDRFCEQGEMLTLAPTPQLRQFREWYTKQVADQVQGKPPSPWPYGP